MYAMFDWPDRMKRCAGLSSACAKVRQARKGRRRRFKD
jgi:hypothetical protein